MPLAVRQDGSVVGGSPNTIYAAWFNDYYNLLTGVMTDQDVTLKTDLITQAIGAAPGAPTLSLAAGSGLGIGVYKYGVSFVKHGQWGETLLGTVASITTTSGSQEVQLSGIPTGPAGTTSRRIYRSQVGTNTFTLLTELADNTTTAYLDTATDASISGNTAPQAASSFGGRVLAKNAAGSVTASIYGSNGQVWFDSGGIYSDGGGHLYATDVQIGGHEVMVQGAGSFAGRTIYIGPTQPTTMVKGDIWIKTPFS